MDDLPGFSARALLELIRSRQLSPVELFDACIESIERIDPFVNAMVAHDFARGRLSAKAAEAAVMRGEPGGLLHGLPVAIKDLSNTEGLRTTFGSLLYKDNIPKRDELMVARLKQAGAIIIGKTNTPEFGAGANTVNRVYGATVNPFNPLLSAAGSSGGSAAALATGMVPLATGSDMGGSLRTPASFCGIVGHRTSPGAVPSDVRRYGWSPLSVEGPMARNVADAALMMAALAGEDARDPLSFEVDRQTLVSLAPVDLSALRVGFCATPGGAAVSQSVRRHFRDCAERIGGFFGSADWVDPPLGAVERIFETLRAVAYAENYGDYAERHRDIAGPNVLANAAFAKSISARDVGWAQAEQTALVRRFQKVFEEIDLLICPAASTVPFPVEETYVAEIDGERLSSYIAWIGITYALTLTGHPVTALPCGRGPTGMPFGLQIVGRWRDDAGTLAAAAALEAAFADDPLLRRPVPDIGRLTLPETQTRAGLIPTGLTAHLAV